MLMTKIIFIFAQWVCGRSYRPLKTLKKSVLRDRDLTGKYEKGVIMTIKISHLGFSECWFRIWSQILKFFSSRGPRPQKTVFQKTRPIVSGGENFSKKIIFRISFWCRIKWYRIYGYLTGFLTGLKFLSYIMAFSLWLKKQLVRRALLVNFSQISTNSFFFNGL